LRGGTGKEGRFQEKVVRPAEWGGELRLSAPFLWFGRIIYQGQAEHEPLQRVHGFHLPQFPEILAKFVKRSGDTASHGRATDCAGAEREGDEGDDDAALFHICKTCLNRRKLARDSGLTKLHKALYEVARPRSVGLRPTAW
jgi:hypothetical protein